MQTFRSNAMKYQKIAFDEVKNAYVISERDDSGQLIATYTAYPNFTNGTFSCYPRTLVKGERYRGKIKLNMDEVES